MSIVLNGLDWMFDGSCDLKKTRDRLVFLRFEKRVQKKRTLYCGVDEAELPVVIEPQTNAGGDPGIDSGLLFGGVEDSTRSEREKC